MVLRPYLFLLLLTFAGLACVSTGPSAERLAEINQAHEDDDLATFYTVSEKYVSDFPRHPSSDKVRYDWALQLVSENLTKPTSPDAEKARGLLEEVYKTGHKQFERFMSGLVLMKFATGGQGRALGAELLQAFSGYEQLDQVYYWLIQDALNRNQLMKAAEYVKALARDFPEHGYQEKYLPISRRANILKKAFPFPKKLRSEFQGKFVLVDFWATYCEPCLAAVPKLLALHKRLPKSSFSILGVSIDENEAVYEAFMKNSPFTWDSIFTGEDEDSLATQLGVDAIPSYFIISPEGMVLETELELDDAITFLRKRLK